LKHKTQVYISPENDHYRTRLTHTLEVNQISQTIGRALRLNPDLIEAIALGHDVGHTPFSHNGEAVLNKLLPGGFRHNENSIRVLSFLEKGLAGAGLNLSWEVLDGVICHGGYGKGNPSYSKTLEGQVVRYADKIAYVQHDIDDSIRAGVLELEEIPSEYLEALGFTHSARITTLVTDLVLQSRKQLSNNKCMISLSPPINEALLGLRHFLFEAVYQGDFCKNQREKASFVVEFLFDYFSRKPEEMPEFYLTITQNEGVKRGVADYISGMTDNYCIAMFQKLTIPSASAQNSSVMGE
jgi:dGTPase